MRDEPNAGLRCRNSRLSKVCWFIKRLDIGNRQGLCMPNELASRNEWPTSVLPIPRRWDRRYARSVNNVLGAAVWFSASGHNSEMGHGIASKQSKEKLASKFLGAECSLATIFLQIAHSHRSPSTSSHIVPHLWCRSDCHCQGDFFCRASTCCLLHYLQPNFLCQSTT
jgi:hypothetical protein